MDAQKLAKLRKKYSDHPTDESADQCDDRVPYAGVSTLLDMPYQPELDNIDIALIGVPFDLGVYNRAGARLGPKAIRNVAMFGSFNHHSKISPAALCPIADVGDVPIENRYHLDEGLRDIEKYFQQVKDAGITPLAAGGDHSISYPILKAVGRDAPVGLVHVDAHCDTDGWMGNSKFYHGAPFRNAVLDGVLDPDRTIQIGIRGPAEPVWEFSYESGMTVIHMEDFIEMGLAQVLRRARAVVGDGPTYISFDIDGLDPAYAPGTGTPEIGGLTTREALALIRGLHGLNLVGGDVVEVAPQYDLTTNTARAAAQMMFEILCLLAEARDAKR
ncbi:agmatinase [Alkalispirochaeta odontotermitis]|nr:agmatinase [Alkalispirochaeta odontotermitis]CAB1081518.1 Arginase/agmatinase/formimionoglutamate hydrolase, arginase family [Olavius algarvensis Delta 1 endosymbiont]